MAKRAARKAAKKKPECEPWVVPRLADVARFFGRSLATIKADWRPSGMPGSSGAWDLREILAWRDGRAAASRREGDETSARGRAELRRIQAEAEMAERKNRLAAGELVEVDTVRRLIAGHVNEARAIFEQLPDAVLAACPAKMPAANRRRVERAARKIVEDTCARLADLLERTDAPTEESQAS